MKATEQYTISRLALSASTTVRSCDQPAADDPARPRKRGERCCCGKQRRGRQRRDETETPDDPVPREDRRGDALACWQLEGGEVSDEVPDQHERARYLDERTQVEQEHQRRAYDAERCHRAVRRPEPLVHRGKGSR